MNQDNCPIGAMTNEQLLDHYTELVEGHGQWDEAKRTRAELLRRLNDGLDALILLQVKEMQSALGPPFPERSGS